MKPAFLMTGQKTAIALYDTENKQWFGRIIVNHGKSITDTISLVVYYNKHRKIEGIIRTVKTSGHGYNKLSDALMSLVVDCGIQDIVPGCNGNGTDKQRFEQAGIAWLDVV